MTAMTIEEINARQAALDAAQQRIGQELNPSEDAAGVRVEYWQLECRKIDLLIADWRARLAEAEADTVAATPEYERAKTAFDTAKRDWDAAQLAYRRAGNGERKAVEKLRLLERQHAESTSNLEASEDRLAALQRANVIKAERQAAAAANQQAQREQMHTPLKERQRRVREAAGRLPTGERALGDVGEP